MLKLYYPFGFTFGPQNGNSGNWVVYYDIFTVFCDTYLLSWTWYLRLVHFSWMDSFLYLPWSITSFFRDGSDRCFWNYFARVMYFFTVYIWIYICLSYPASQVSCTVDIKMERNLLSIAFKHNLSTMSWLYNTAISDNIICVCQHW